MKITTFNPQIITRNAEDIVKLFEELGFKKRHEQEGIGVHDVTGIRMKNDDGFYLDISQTDVLPAEAMTVIRMNVDDYEAAYKLLSGHGFKNVYGARAVETKSSKSAVMISPSGFAINLIQHIKD